MSSELKAALRELLHETSASAPQPLWLDMMRRLAETLGTEIEVIGPFIEAWRTLYAVTLVLDHLQDGDPLGAGWLDAQRPAIQYHVAFSAYIAAQHALARLDAERLPAARVLRLQRFWASSVAQLASGQYLDLTQTLTAIQTQGLAPLTVYEQLAVQKTGTTFALAFGGVALLTTDDEAMITALTDFGMVYGMLLQYRDDLDDSEAQAHQTEAATFSRALLATHPQLAAWGPIATMAFWTTIYASYTQALDSILAPVSPETRALCVELLHRSFGDPDRLTGASLVAGTGDARAS
jgi:hypothetical protein